MNSFIKAFTDSVTSTLRKKFRINDGLSSVQFHKIFGGHLIIVHDLHNSPRSQFYFLWSIECTSETLHSSIIFIKFHQKNSFFAQGTSVQCTLPSNQGTTDCTQPLPPGTIASYSCRDPFNNVMQGFLRCQNSGVWMTSLKEARNSLCGLRRNNL